MPLLYAVASGDTLESLAARFYGDPEQWPRLAADNNLAPPYISDLPRVRYGNPVRSLLLERVLPAGSFFALFPAVEDGDLYFRPGYRFYVEQTTIGGTVETAILDIQEYDRDGHRVLFYAPVPTEFVVGSAVYVFPPRFKTEMRVAGPGDMLRITGVLVAEGEGQPAPDYIISEAEWQEALGTDILLREDGQLAWDAERRDFDSTRGSENLRQAIMGAIHTPLGWLDHHPEYGCEALDLVGEKNEPGFAAMVATYLREAIEKDPRVAQVEGIGVELRGDALYIAVRVEVSRTGMLYDVANVVLRYTEV